MNPLFSDWFRETEDRQFQVPTLHGRLPSPRECQGQGEHKSHEYAIGLNSDVDKHRNSWHLAMLPEWTLPSPFRGRQSIAHWGFMCAVGGGREHGIAQCGIFDDYSYSSHSSRSNITHVIFIFTLLLFREKIRLLTACRSWVSGQWLLSALTTD